MSNPIDDLRDHCLNVMTGIEAARGKSLALATAKSKLAEMIYWLRADEARRQREEASQRPLQEPERMAAVTPPENEGIAHE